LKKVRLALALFGMLSILVALIAVGIELEGRLALIYGALGVVLLGLFGLLEWRHRHRRASPVPGRAAGLPGSVPRRGAALILALAAVALVASLLAMGAAQAHGLNAEQRRASRQARLHVAVWNETWSRIRSASGAPEGIPAPGVREAPDGVKTTIAVQRIGPARRGEPVRFALSTTAELERDHREAWSLVQRTMAGEYRILTWVER
jgi:hypothetical protein